MPIYTATIPQDFWEHNFQQGAMAPPPLKIAYVYLSMYNFLACTQVATPLVVVMRTNPSASLEMSRNKHSIDAQ